MKLLKYCALMAAAFCVVAGTVRADIIQFTLTGTADSTKFGYTSGQSYSFSWIMNSGFTNNVNCIFSDTENLWTEEFVDRAPIFTDVRGDGLTGTWQRPVLSEGDPLSYVDVMKADGTHYLQLLASNDSDYSIGLTAGGTDIQIVNGKVEMTNSFSYPQSYTDPGVYFAGHVGTYTPVSGFIELVNVGRTDGILFTATSVNISAIPEPSTTVLVAFGGVAALLRFRRNRRRPSS